MHCIRLDNQIDPYNFPIQEILKIESISPRWINDQNATLLFVFGGFKKYYDGSVAFYFKIDSFFVFDPAIPKFLFD